MCSSECGDVFQNFYRTTFTITVFHRTPPGDVKVKLLRRTWLYRNAELALHERVIISRKIN